MGNDRIKITPQPDGVRGVPQKIIGDIMGKDEILRQVQTVMRDIFCNEGIVLTETTTVGDVEGWDSISHIQLIAAFEKRFNIKFTSKEILSWKTVGELAASIQARRNYA
jgi:acyl carrier protein